ncbi:MAG: MBL fold metallo-hydrolase [Acidobacteriota bacterium]|nr:MAG: MBL fold metallo-hydrolase [Acidobacteriota bacterium]
MKLQFFGGARTVTGSQHILTVEGKRILLECGLFQGRREETYRRNLNFDFDPESIDLLLLSHAHIDHCGNIPNLVKRGFRGRILATSATVDLCQIMLRDSAFLHQKDVEFVNKIRKRKDEPPIEPLYTIEDAEKAMQHFVAVEYGKTYTLFPRVRATFRDAGHILGSAGILLEMRKDGKPYRLGFTGDLGRKDVPILKDPNYLRDLDAVIMESTYGNRDHRLSDDVEEELATLVRKVVKDGGKIIIPAFAVGRTQLIVYLLHKLFDQNRIPDLPIFVDSPMAVNATEVFRRNPDCFDRATHRIFVRNNMDPFGFGRLRYVRSVDESKKLNGVSYPHIIISASGMAEGGRILHHLRNNIGNPKNLILLVGYAAEHTLARRLTEGRKLVKIFGEEHPLRARVIQMDDFSAHADRKGLLRFIDIQSREKLGHVFLVHGEEEQALPLKKSIQDLGFQSVHFPDRGQVYNL